MKQKHVPTLDELNDAVLRVADFTAQHLIKITDALKVAGYSNIAKELEKRDRDWQVITYARVINACKDGATALMKELNI